MSDLKEVIADVLDIPAAEVRDDLGGRLTEWSSMKQVELVVAIEEEYGVSLSRQDIHSMLSVRNIRELLAAKGIRA